MTAERDALIEPVVQIVQRLQIRLNRLATLGSRSARHDLPPEEASQIVWVGLGEVSVRHQEVLPAVIIEVGEH